MPGRVARTLAHVALEVGTGAERAALPRQHHDAYVGILGRLLEQVGQVVEAVGGDGVESVGSGERHPQHGTVVNDRQRVCGPHAGTPTGSSMPASRDRTMAAASVIIVSMSSAHVGMSWIRPCTMPTDQTPASGSPSS